MNGAVIPDTPIAVDFWKLRQCPHSRIFFLSHMHADHTVGLTSSWARYPIYCSEVTRKLLLAKVGVKSELVVGLPIDESVTVNLDEIAKETMSVTLVDANHCPGAVMFIFEGYFGKILYTGDFRFCESMASHPAISARQFDMLYLDNTYCDPRCAFPTRAEATGEILEIIRKHPEYNIVIGLHYLGKETILQVIAMVFQTWIGVDPSRKETLELLEMPNVFTCDLESVRIRVVNAQRITKKNMELWNAGAQTIAILPTCLYVGLSNPFANVPGVYVVPYSDHCSYEELEKFVQIVNPRNIIPVVHKHRLSADEKVNSRVNMSCFGDLTDSCQSSPYTIPSSVKNYMTFQGDGFLLRKVRKRNRRCLLRKASGVEKPCGVVFPSNVEKTEMEDVESDEGRKNSERSVLNRKLEEVLPQDQNSASKRQHTDWKSSLRSSDLCIQKKESGEKFNIYKGCSCDFARKLLEHN